MTFRRDGTIERDAVTLHGARATPPAGVVAAAARLGRDRVTWQPAPGDRFALVAVRSGDRVIVAGQSLGPAEARIDQLTGLVGAAWALATVLAVLAVFGSAAWRAVVDRARPGGPQVGM